MEIYSDKIEESIDILLDSDIFVNNFLPEGSFSGELEKRLLTKEHIIHYLYSQNLMAIYSEKENKKINILVVDDETDMEVLILQRFKKEMQDGLYGFSFAEISPINVANNITVPTFIIQGNDDKDFDQNDSTLINNTLPALTPKLLWRVDDCEHVKAYQEPDYFDRVSQFISDNV